MRLGTRGTSRKLGLCIVGAHMLTRLGGGEGGPPYHKYNFDSLLVMATTVGTIVPDSLW